MFKVNPRIVKATTAFQPLRIGLQKPKRTFTSAKKEFDWKIEIEKQPLLPAQAKDTKLNVAYECTKRIQNPKQKQLPGTKASNQIIRFQGPFGLRELDLSKWYNGGVIPLKDRPGEYFVHDKIFRTFQTALEERVEGVTQGFFNRLVLKGVGFRGFSRGNHVILQLGFNNVLVYKLPPNVFGKVRKQKMIFFSNNKQALGQVAADIKSLKKPDPYKGKGVSFVGEVMKLKTGKVR